VTPTDGIDISYADGVVLNNDIWLGSGLGSGTDTGGIVADHTVGLQIIGFQSNYSAWNPIRLTNAGDTRIVGFRARDSGLAATPVANSYAISIDANSTRTYIHSSDNTESRSPGYGRGVNNGGQYTTMIGWEDSTPVSSPTVLGTATAITTNVFGQMQIAGNVTLSGQTQLGTSSTSTLTQVQQLSTASCTTGSGTIGNSCVTTMSNFSTAFADTSYKVTCSIMAPTTGLPYISAITKTTTNLSVAIAAGNTAAASGTIECTAIHQ
jgi:hypothetical protein